MITIIFSFTFLYGVPSTEISLCVYGLTYVFILYESCPLYICIYIFEIYKVPYVRYMDICMGFLMRHAKLSPEISGGGEQ